MGRPFEFDLNRVIDCGRFEDARRGTPPAGPGSRPRGAGRDLRTLSRRHLPLRLRPGRPPGRRRRSNRAGVLEDGRCDPRLPLAGDPVRVLALSNRAQPGGRPLPASGPADTGAARGGRGQRPLRRPAWAGRVLGAAPAADRGGPAADAGPAAGDQAAFHRQPGGRSGGRTVATPAGRDPRSPASRAEQPSAPASGAAAGGGARRGRAPWLRWSARWTSAWVRSTTGAHCRTFSAATPDVATT